MGASAQDLPFTAPSSPNPLAPKERQPGVWVGDDEVSRLQIASQERMDQVIEVLQNPEETDLGGAMRILAIEIASTLGHHQGGMFQAAKGTNERIKNLRELSKQIQESADMTSRDYLNFDGPRFQYVFKEMMLLFRSSVIKAGLPSDTSDHILRVFREEFVNKEQDLRRETAKLDPSTMDSTFNIERAVVPVPDIQPTDEVPHA